MKAAEKAGTVTRTVFLDGRVVDKVDNPLAGGLTIREYMQPSAGIYGVLQREHFAARIQNSQADAA